MIILILGLLLGAASVYFALQNMAIITVTFFSWELTGSLATILLLAITSGVVIALLISLPSTVRGYFRYQGLKRENKRLEEELRKQKELTVFAQKTPPTAEDISRIEKGAIASS